MFSFIYFCAVLGIFIFALLFVFLLRNSGRFYGKTLSQWIDKTRHKEDEYSAERLKNVQKLLEILAHDILKHRILGMASLIDALRTELATTPLNAIPIERQEMIRNEFFRICGLKANPEERLWTRWKEIFEGIYRNTSVNTTIPPLDPMFHDTIHEIFTLRRLLMVYVDKEAGAEEFLDRLRHLKFDKCVDVYPSVLRLAAASRMVIEPMQIIRRAVNGVAAQTRRSASAERIEILGCPEGCFLCPAPTGLLVMCLTRLFDNALEMSETIGVEVEISTDAFTGISTILWKVYDAHETLPTPAHYGMGIRGIRQNISSFEGGFQFRREARGSYRKAAVISFPVSEEVEFPVTKLPRRIQIGFIAWCHLLLFALFFCIFFVIGGPPVEFAGEGSNITEFSVNVGEELVIPLCEGGRKVRVDVERLNAACMADNCTFPQILTALEPCARDLHDPQCPGEIRWTPQFEDGIRQGKNYELSIHCISEGPPSSEDRRHIRVLVTRANTPPQILLLQILNRTRGDVTYVRQGETIKAGVTDMLFLHAMASDPDADPITYMLHLPDGHVVSSADGTFALESSWSGFGTATYMLEITDSVAPSQSFPIVLEADTYHPIEMRSLSLWSEANSTKYACEGSSDSRVCPIEVGSEITLEMDIQFDPIQASIRPDLEFLSTDTFGYTVQSKRRRVLTGVGDQWEIYDRSHQLTSVIELTHVESVTTSGLWRFTFRLIPVMSLPDHANFAMMVAVAEHAQKMPPLRTLLVFAGKSPTQHIATFSTRQLELSEYALPEDESESRATTWIYPLQNADFEPELGAITCQQPEFAQAFETPVIRNIHNAWRIEYRLKRGCIPGLSPGLSARNRLCTAEVRLEGAQNPAESIWITLQPRSCAPQIHEFTLASTREELQNNIFRWNFEIIDTDGDLPAKNIRIHGTQNYAIQMSTKADALGDVYTGSLSMATTCENPLFQSNSRVQLQIKDEDGHEVNKVLTPQLNCPPIVTAPETHFTVEDGSLLAIPLQYESDVHLTLQSRFGSLGDHTFYWNASCAYGKGPHLVEIRTESATRYGRPLVLEIEIAHCQPHFSIQVDGREFSANQPLILNEGKRVRLTLSSRESLEGVTIEPVTNATMPHVLFTSRDESGFDYDVECDAAGVNETIQFEMTSPKFNTPQESPKITIQCVEAASHGA